jgi:hypothetical protein
LADELDAFFDPGFLLLSPDFPAKHGLLQSLIDKTQKVFDGKRAGQIREGSGHHALNGGINRGLVGDENYFKLRPQASGFVHELNAIHVRGLHAGKQDMKMVLLEFFQGGFRRYGAGSLIPFPLQKMANIVTIDVVRVDDHYSDIFLVSWHGRISVAYRITVALSNKWGKGSCLFKIHRFILLI